MSYLFSKQLIKIFNYTKPVYNLVLVNNYIDPKSQSILRDRFMKRKKDNTKYEYNESITIIPPEFADQDEYLNEKKVTKYYQDKYERQKQRRLKRAFIQLPDESKVSDDKKCDEKKLSRIKRANNDLPVNDIDNPYTQPMHQCIFCKYKINLDYKNVQLLSQFVSPQTGLLYRQEVTGLCVYKYEELERTVRKSREAGLMPYFYKEKTYIHDPVIVDGFKDKLREIQTSYDVRKLNNNIKK